MEAMEFISALVGQPLCYGIKSPDMDLYDFGFGSAVSAAGLKGKVCEYTLHVTCRFKVIWRNAEKRVDVYDESSPCKRFHSELRPLLGLKVRRIALSDKNDLWLDFGDCWMVFATFEDVEESWRFFTYDKNKPHLVASDSKLSFSG